MASMTTPTKTNKRGPVALTDSHKAAMAEGRKQGRAVRNYLEALEAHKPKRGRRRTPESMRTRLAAIGEELPTADPITRLGLIQERMDLEAELEAVEQVVDLSALEADFVDSARAYGERKGISYAAWRELGVSAAVLREAGIGR
jgi:hypothetical protein